MKKNIILGVAAVAIATSVIAVACKKNQNFEPQATDAGPSALAVDPCGCTLDNGQYKDTVTLPTVISANRTLTCDTLWRLNGKTYVTGGTPSTPVILTIAAGARIEGVKKSTPDSASALIITRNNRLMSNGTQSCPIVFTSAQASPAPGDWGGIVLLGKAPLNRADTTIEGIGEPSLPVGVDINYGGGGACTGTAADNSGSLRFVRIEYAGAVIQEGNELNGLTMGGVGSGTVLQFIQVAYGADDGFEFFGGTVNARNLISYGNNDDDLDFDFGYTGRIQFVVASKVPSPAAGYSSTANGIESDNIPGGSCATCKVTLDSTAGSYLDNVTIIGDPNCANSKGLDFGGFFRNGSYAHLKNSIVIDYPVGLNITSTCAALRPRWNRIQGQTSAADPVGVRAFVATYNDTLSACPTSGGGNSFVSMVNPYAATPVFTLAAGSPAATGANHAGLTGATATTYRGAFNLASVAGSDWTANWTRWNF